MRFIERVIGPDEKLIGVGMAHWIYGMKGLFWMGGLMMLGLWVASLPSRLLSYFERYQYIRGQTALDIAGSGAFWTCTVLGLVLFFIYFIMMISTEIGLTNKRIIFKRGLIFTDVKEIDLEEIKAADVNNGWFGRFLNYGYLQLDARFVSNMNLPAIGDPYRFVKALNEIRGKIKQDSMTIVIDGHDQVKTKQQSAPESEIPQLGDPRYDSFDGNPAKAAREVIQESRELMDKQNRKGLQAEARIKAGIKGEEIKPHTPAETPPRPSETPAPPQPAENPVPQPPAENPVQNPPEGVPTPPTEAPPPQNVAQSKGPIVFERENLREELKEKIIDSFEDTAHSNAA